MCQFDSMVYCASVKLAIAHLFFLFFFFVVLLNDNFSIWKQIILQCQFCNHLLAQKCSTQVTKYFYNNANMYYMFIFLPFFGIKIACTE